MRYNSTCCCIENDYIFIKVKMRPLTIFFLVFIFILLVVVVVLKKISRRLPTCTLAYVHKELKRMLNIFTQLLDVYNYEYFIHSGTLLGSVRTGDIIPHDDDIDIDSLFG